MIFSTDCLSAIRRSGLTRPERWMIISFTFRHCQRNVWKISWTASFRYCVLQLRLLWIDHSIWLKSSFEEQSDRWMIFSEQIDGCIFPFGSQVKLEMVCLNQLEKLSNGNFLIKHIISINYKFSLSPVSRSSQALNLFALSLSLHLSWHFPWTSITKYESFSLWQWSTICDCNQYKDWKK